MEKTKQSLSLSTFQMIVSNRKVVPSGKRQDKLMDLLSSSYNSSNVSLFYDLIVARI